MSQDPRLGHNDETQTDLNSVPKTYHLTRRNGVFYSRRRIPADLARAEAFGRKKEIKQSLKTADQAKAKRLAEVRDLQLSTEFEDMRRKLQPSGSLPNTGNQTEQRSDLRPLSSLSNLELSTLLQLAEVESKRRTVETLSGETCAQPDRRFSGLAFGSPLPDSTKTYATILELCAKFLKAKQKAGVELKKGSFKSISPKTQRDYYTGTVKRVIERKPTDKETARSDKVRVVYTAHLTDLVWFSEPLSISPTTSNGKRNRAPFFYDNRVC